VKWNGKAAFFRPVGQAWERMRAGNQSVAVDTLTTRFLLLFLFLLSIPLATVIIFTVSLLINHMDEADTRQMFLVQHMLAGQLAEVGEKMALLEELQPQGQLNHALPSHFCEKLNITGCLLVDPAANQLVLGEKSTHSLSDARKMSVGLAGLNLASLGHDAFYARVQNQMYLMRRLDLTAKAGKPALLGLPLDQAFFNRLYSLQPSLQPEIWVVDDHAGASKLLLEAYNPGLGQQAPIAPLLTQIQERNLNPSQPVRLKVNDVPYLIMQEDLASQTRMHIGRLLYIMPLDRNQLVLGNYYVGIYVIAVASLIFSVLLAMAAGRTITQPLLKLIDQVNKLSRETVTRDDAEVSITGVFEIQQLGEAFNRMIKRLHQEHKMRDDFVATLTHDLKVPLLAEKQTLTYMRNQTYGPVTEEQVEVLDSLQSSNRSCLSLVTGLLEVYRYDTGEVALVYDSFNMVSLLTEIAAEFQALAHEKQIEMHVDSTIPVAHEDAMVYADRLEIKRVLGNLISNAIVNTPKHGTIRCKITNAEYYGGDTIYKVSSFQHTSLKHPIKLIDRLLVTIQDSGLGFSSKDLTALFKQFAANKSRNPMSIGLGLYNCHQVLKAHKGVVWVESTEGEGSLVSFILPQNKKAAQDRRIFRDRRRYS